ncbi:DA1-related 1-like protein isoform X1, partial [Tanacetum coccineum]
MGWLTKIIKGSSSGSSHRVSERQDQDTYENDEIWEEPPATVDASSDFDYEEIDRAIALSLVEEDERSVLSLVEDDKKSAHSSVKEEEEEEDDDDDEGSVSSLEDQNNAVPTPIEQNRGSSSITEEDHKGKKVIDDKSYLEDDEELAKAIQLSLNVDSPPRINRGSLLFPRLPSFLQGVYSLPIDDYEFSMSENRPFHKSCYKEHHHPKCDVCKNFIPTNAGGLIEYRAHPFWLQKYCPSHERDGT